VGNFKYYVALAITLAVLIGKYVHDHRDPAASASASLPSLPSGSGTNSPAQRPLTDKTPWVHEQHWLVDAVTRDVVEMLAFIQAGTEFDASKVALTLQPKDATGLSYQVTATIPGLPDIQQAITLSQHLWAPENYVALGRALASAMKLQASDAGSAAPSDLPVALTQPDTATLLRENRRITEALAQHPLNATLHEEASLLIGTLALREAAGKFNDIRPALCRMTAHLVMAACFQEKPGPTGQLARIVQETLVDRQAAAIQGLEEFPSLPEAWQPWVRALKMRATLDWRLLPAPEKATLLEQLAYARAITLAVDAAPLQNFLSEHEIAVIPDWHRLVLATAFGVEQGHVFATKSIPTEFVAAVETHQLHTGKKLDDLSLLVSALNEPATRAVTSEPAGSLRLQPLSWGTLAAFHQRHLLHCVASTHLFFAKRWGVPEEAASLREMAQQNLAALQLYPLLQLCNFCETTVDSATHSVAVDFCVAKPELVTACMWFNLENTKTSNGIATRPPASRRWFPHGLIFGCPFEYSVRHYELHCVPHQGDTAIASLVTAAPHAYYILFGYAGTLGPNRADALKTALSPIAPYHLNAAYEIAEPLKHDPKAYSEAMKAVCSLDPNAYIGLGEYLSQHGLAQDAAEAFEAGFQKAPDRIRMSNKSEWYVNYLFDHGQKEKALEVANEAAEVYSFRGLQTAAGLMTRMEQWADAFELFEAIAERYRDLLPLMTHLLAHKDSVPEVATQHASLVAKTFPNGLRKVTLADFKDKPKRGAVFTSSSALTQQYQINPGTVIVALDEHAIDSMAQYEFVRALSPNAPLQLIVWDGATYRELTANIPDRRFQCGMESYLDLP
jgi:tetratricopeptide (TPR) repeat protein